MKGKVAIVTGAFGILGRAVVERFSAAGAQVVCVDMAKAAPADWSARDTLNLGGVDLGKPEDAARAVAQAMERYKRIDALINVAGGFRWQTVADAEPGLWDLMLTMNLKTATNMCRAALTHLAASGGAIVNVGAGAAQKAAAGMGPYTASKAAVHRLTEALAEEWKGKVRVNAVLPSILDTPQNRADMPSADFGKWVRPADLAAAIQFLASEDARAITGALVPVSGLV